MSQACCSGLTTTRFGACSAVVGDEELCVPCVVSCGCEPDGAAAGAFPGCWRENRAPTSSSVASDVVKNNFFSLQTGFADAGLEAATLDCVAVHLRRTSAQWQETDGSPEEARLFPPAELQ